MPIQPTYPGVYVEEVASGVRTITGVSTSTTAFIGRTLRGPTDEPVTINSFSDFERIFGGLWQESKLGFAVRDYFRNGGGQAIIVRLYHPSRTDTERETARQAAQDIADEVEKAARKAETDPLVTRATVVKAAEGKNTTYAGGDAIKKDAAGFVFNAVKNASLSTTPDSVKDVARREADEYAALPTTEAAEKVANAARYKAATGATADDVAAAAIGEARNIATDSDLTIAAAEATAKAAKDEADENKIGESARNEANKYVGQPQESAANRIAAAAESATGNAAKTAANDEATKVKEEANALKAAATAVAMAAKGESAKNITVLVDAANKAVLLVASFTKARIKADTLELEAADEGAWGNALRVRVDDDVSDVTDEQMAAGLTKNDFFNLTVYDGATGVTEVFRNVTVKASSRKINEVLRGQSKLVRVRGNLVETVPAKNGDITKDLKLWGDNPTNYAVTGKGSDGTALEGADFLDRGEKKGMCALDKADLFNLLCIPPHLADRDDIDSRLVDDAAAYCVKRRAFFLLDAPSSWIDKQAAIDRIKECGAPSANAAVFFPRLKQPNPLKKGMLEDFVPCGAIAGVFARTDAQRGVWKAPAGLDATLLGAQELTVSLTDEENGELNPRGINCLRTLPAVGRVVWGSRTRVGDDRLASEWKYIPVRRTALYIEESLYRSTQWVVFEPNDERLWSQIRLNIGAFMHNLFRQGAFQGTTPRDAYLVKCDKETTTQTDINLGIVNILVGFAPLKPAEFVMIKLQQIAGQIQA